MLMDSKILKQNPYHLGQGFTLSYYVPRHESFYFRNWQELIINIFNLSNFFTTTILSVRRKNKIYIYGSDVCTIFLLNSEYIICS